MSLNTEMIEITCGECGIEFSMPKKKRDELLDTGDTFYCPNGHRRAFINSWKTRFKKQKEKTAETEQDRDYWRKKYWNMCRERDHLERQKNGLYGYIAKLKKKLEAQP